MSIKYTEVPSSAWTDTPCTPPTKTIEVLDTSALYALLEERGALTLRVPPDDFYKTNPSSPRSPYVSRTYKALYMWAMMQRKRTVNHKRIAADLIYLVLGGEYQPRAKRRTKKGEAK